MLRRIKLYGSLAKFIGKRVLYADVATAAEAVRFLVANWPELRQHMGDKHYRVFVGSWNLSADELHSPAGQQEIKIVPVVGGANKTLQAIGKIVAGAALIALSIVGGTFIGPIALKIIGSLGAALVLGGVAQLITPTPQLGTTATGNAAGGTGLGGIGGVGQDSAKDPRKSYSFSGIQNVSRQGLPISLIYGETIVGSIVASAGIDVDRRKK
jgi:predicted phage tail protein